MDGKIYIDSFRAGVPASPDYTSMRDSTELLNSSHVSLAGKIALLYGNCELDLLGGTLVPEVLARSVMRTEDCQALERIASAESGQQLISSRVAGNTSTPKFGDIEAIKAADATGTMSPAELVAFTVHSRNTYISGMATYSDLVLESAMYKVHTLAKTREVSNKDAAKIVRDVICNGRKDFNTFVAGARGIITEERDFTLRQGVTDRQVDRRVIVQLGGQYIPEWLRGDPEWDEPLQLICSLYTEIQALIAANEYVLDKNLPFLPVLAPKTYEQGDFSGTTSYNTHANILLCSMVPGRNEIIPMQVMTTVRGVDRDTYHPGIVLVGTRELGMQSFESCIVDDQGRKKIGHRGVATYGELLEYYLRMHGSKGKNRTLGPSKQDRINYRTMLQNHAFAYFDEALLPKTQPQHVRVSVKA